jgi:hypothetical protein
MKYLFKSRLNSKLYTLAFVSCLLLSLVPQSNSLVEEKSKLVVPGLVNNLQTQSNLAKFNGDSDIDTLKAELKRLQTYIVQARNDKCLFDLNGEFDYSSIEFNKINRLNVSQNTLAYINATVNEFNSNVDL